MLHLKVDGSRSRRRQVHPGKAWVKQQAQAFLKHVEHTGLGATIVMHDRDTKFTASFDDVLKSADLEVRTIHAFDIDMGPG